MTWERRRPACIFTAGGTPALSDYIKMGKLFKIRSLTQIQILHVGFYEIHNSLSIYAFFRDFFNVVVKDRPGSLTPFFSFFF